MPRRLATVLGRDAYGQILNICNAKRGWSPDGVPPEA